MACRNVYSNVDLLGMYVDGPHAHETPGNGERVLLQSLKAAKSGANPSIFRRKIQNPNRFWPFTPMSITSRMRLRHWLRPNFIDWDNVPADDRHAIRHVAISSLRTATKSTLTISGMIPLYVRIGTLIAPTCVAIVKNLTDSIHTEDQFSR